LRLQQQQQQQQPQLPVCGDEIASGDFYYHL
jgi:hypothetical protein